MLFSSNVFLFGFLPLCLLAYFLVPTRAKNYVLLAFSLLFYAWGGPSFTFVLLSIVAIDYLAALAIDAPQLKDNANARRGLLILALILNLGTLCYFKYLGFFTDCINGLIALNIPRPDIVLPIGISFYTFQSVSYVIDVYRRQVPAQRNPLTLLLYVSMFPQLVAGPIVRYKDIAEQLSDRQITLSGVAYGIERFILGLFKKLFIADSLGALADSVYGSADPAMPIAWLGALAYMFQIYYDFSAYSDMAIGLGRIFGFRFLENFNYPYVSQSITEFWRRWHMSLGNWFRDYVYIPLGGNRKGIRRQIINIAIVWALTGFWHGAAWTFILWGVYFGVLLLIEKLVLLKAMAKWPIALRIAYALVIVFFGWVLFRAENFDTLVMMMQALFSFGTIDATSLGQAWLYLQSYGPYFLIAIIFSMPIYPRLRSRLAAIRNPQRKNIARIICYVILFVILGIAISFMAHASYTPFIYFRF